MMDSALKLANGFPRLRKVLIALVIVLAISAIGVIHYWYVSPVMDYANKDFMSLWTGARAILDGVNPYDEAVWEPLRARYGSSWMPDSRAPFPLWTSVLMVPFAMLPIPVAAAAWLTLQELLFVAGGYFIVKEFRRREGDGLQALVLALVGFTSVSMVLVLINGQMTFLLFFILALFVVLYERQRLLLAGVMLALLALKPNPFIALVPLLGLWLLWRKEWRVIGGGAIMGLIMLAVTWALQPGWLSAWFNVRSKTAVVTITPTLWGLAAEVGGAWWAPLGFGLVAFLMAAVGWVVFSRPHLGASEVVSVGLAASLLATPYTWAYEHALLFLPWLWLFAVAEKRDAAVGIWLLLAWLLPWLVFVVAVVRINDSLGFIVPLATLGMLLWSIRNRHHFVKAHGKTPPL